MSARGKGPALERALLEGYPPGEYVGQESFVSAGEIVSLARAAGIGAGSEVLDLCCGVGAPALHLADTLGCRVIGTDRSADAVRLARAEAEARGLAGHACFLVGDAVAPPLRRTFDAALVIETMISIPDKARLLGACGGLLRAGTRLGLTLEEGQPLSPREQVMLPEGDRSWLISEREFQALAEASGFAVRLVEDHTARHAEVVRRLLSALERHRAALEAELGGDAYQTLLAAHRCWADWLGWARVRKLAMVLERAS